MATRMLVGALLERRRIARARRRYLASDTRRVARLEAADAPTRELEDLQWIARTLRDASDDPGCDPCELEPLLDLYADLAVSRAKCHTLLACIDRGTLARRIAIARPATARVLARRILHAGAVAQRRQALDESLADVSQLVRWCAERSYA